jgi:hypothetical protein
MLPSMCKDCSNKTESKTKSGDASTDCIRNYEIAKSHNLLAPTFKDKNEGQMNLKAFFHSVTSNEF